MAYKIFLSTWTYRSLAQQRETLQLHMGDMFETASAYTDEEGLGFIMRPTTRKGTDDIWVASIACLAQNAEQLAEVIKFLNAKQAFLHCAEESLVLRPKISIAEALKAWKDARTNGAARIGGRISAEKKKALTRAAADKIRDRWPLSSEQWPTSVLLEEAGISLNTAKTILGRRPIEQANYQAKMKRRERRDAARA